jgi:multisubunit Na+/H+ antiporter MnhG subunit
MSGFDTTGERRRLRRFGFTIAIGFTVLGAVGLWRHHTIAPTVWFTMAVALGLLGTAAPMLLQPFERVWQALGDRLGWINTRIILTALFYVVVTPAGLLMRLFRDPLDRDIYEARASYWNRRSTTPLDPDTYQRQF